MTYGGRRRPRASSTTADLTADLPAPTTTAAILRAPTTTTADLPAPATTTADLPAPSAAAALRSEPPLQTVLRRPESVPRNSVPWTRKHCGRCPRRPVGARDDPAHALLALSGQSSLSIVRWSRERGGPLKRRIP